MTGIPLYSADNADILQSTIDGRNTLHMMGIIKSTLSQENFTDVPVKKRAPTADNLLQHIIPIQYSTKFNKTEVNVNLRSISDFNIAKVTPEWSGFMRLITRQCI